MTRTPGKVFGVLCLLAAVFVVTYWVWDPARPASGITFEAPPADPRAGEEPGEPHDVESAGASEPAPEEGPAQAEPGPRVIPPEFVEHRVGPGETWEDISLTHYGTRAHAEAILRANPFKSAATLREGDVVRVPVDPGNVQGVVEGEAGEAEKPQPEPVREYVVQEGDSLGAIAQRVYGSASRWRVLYEYNRERLGLKDERSIRAGQVLLIPPLPEGEDR